MSDKCPKCGVTIRSHERHRAGGIDCLERQLAQAKAENAKLMVFRKDAGDYAVRIQRQLAQAKAERAKLRTRVYQINSLAADTVEMQMAGGTLGGAIQNATGIMDLCREAAEAAEKP